MRAFHYLVLLIGLYLLLFMQVVSIATPRDAYVASALSKSPANWDVTLDDTLKPRLRNDNVKADLLVTLQKRASLRNDLSHQYSVAGATLITLSLLGLIREAQIKSLRNQLHHSPSPATPPTTPPHA